MAGILYLVATPIGNLEDITFRALKTLKEVDIIATEDTRHSLKLLNYFDISKPLISYHKHNEGIKKTILINKLLKGENIAVISDAGTPAISDPGEEIVKEAIANNIKIVPIPGACALISALIVSGMKTTEFSFYGFLPINKKTRRDKLLEIKKDSKTIILYEAPHKIKNTLKDILKEIGDINIVIAREITKIHEEYKRGKISELIEYCEGIKGEIVIILESNLDKIEKEKTKFFEEMLLEEHYEYYKNQGLDKREIIKQIAKDRNVSKNEIYMKFLNE